MLIIRITLNIGGKMFNYKSFMKEVVETVDIEWPSEDSSNYIIIENPKTLGIEQDLIVYEEWYVSFIEKYYDKMLFHGADDIWLFTDVFYSKDQCNFEFFSKEMMTRLSKYSLSYPISAYKISEEKLKSWLLEVGYTEKQIQLFLKND